MNKDFLNNRFFDIYAEKEKNKYVVSVKARNKYENSIAGRKLNSRYKLTDEPGEFAKEAQKKYTSEASWVAIAIDIDQGTFDAYFGTLLMLGGNKKGISMNLHATETYKRLAFRYSLEEIGIRKEEYLYLKNEYRQRGK